MCGFLITHLLLREHERTGTIPLRAFYLRRALRIMPAFYWWLAVVTLLGVLRLLALDWKAAAACLTYTDSLMPGVETRGLERAAPGRVCRHILRADRAPVPALERPPWVPGKPREEDVVFSASRGS
jgi:hypothetical protein